MQKIYSWIERVFKPASPSPVSPPLPTSLSQHLRRDQPHKSVRPSFQHELPHHYKCTCAVTDDAIQTGNHRSYNNINDPLLLFCGVQVAASPVTFQWYKEDKKLSSTGSVHITTFDSSTQLKLHNPKLHDSGIYSCRAENAAGSCKTQSLVEVLLLERDDLSANEIWSGPPRQRKPNNHAEKEHLSSTSKDSDYSSNIRQSYEEPNLQSLETKTLCAESDIGSNPSIISPKSPIINEQTCKPSIIYKTKSPSSMSIAKRPKEPTNTWFVFPNSPPHDADPNLPRRATIPKQNVKPPERRNTPPARLFFPTILHPATTTSNGQADRPLATSPSSISIKRQNAFVVDKPSIKRDAIAHVVFPKHSPLFVIDKRPTVASSPIDSLSCRRPNSSIVDGPPQPVRSSSPERQSLISKEDPEILLPVSYHHAALQNQAPLSDGTPIAPDRNRSIGRGCKDSRFSAPAKPTLSTSPERHFRISMGQETLSPLAEHAPSITKSRPRLDTKTVHGVSYTTRFSEGNIVGSGKFGQVFQCYDLNTNKPCAVKLIHPRSLTGDPMEVEILRKLGQHDQILQLLAVFENHGQWAIVTEFVAGGTLFDRIIAENMLNEPMVRLITRQILLGLQHLNIFSVVHLDLKPENLMMVDQKGIHLKLVDFGLATFYDPAKPPCKDVGTLPYKAPETQAYEPQSFATDLWSVAVIAYELLSGWTPFAMPSDPDMVEELDKDLISINITKVKYSMDDVNICDVSDNAKDFIKRLLVRKPSVRPTIDECLRHPWIQAASVHMSKRSRTWSLRRLSLRVKHKSEDVALPFRVASANVYNPTQMRNGYV